MEITQEHILKVVIEHLSSEEIAKSTICWDTRIRMKGEDLVIGPQKIPMPFDGYMIFVDLAPQANWAHPCLYLLLSRGIQEITRIKASFPPYWGEYPESYKVLLRYGERPPHDRYFTPFDEPTKRERR